MRDLLEQQRRRRSATARRAERRESVTDPVFVNLHLAKNGGGSLNSFLSPLRGTWYHAGHNETVPGLAERFPNAPIFFFVRHPHSRFVSGFYNAHRARLQGVTRLPDIPMINGFHLFPDPDSLARGLRSDDEWTRSAAEYAMRGLPFVRNPMVNNLISPDVVDSLLHRIVFIGLQERFEESVEALRRALSLPAHLELPTSERAGHRSPASLRTSLSDEAKAALDEWYRDDLVLYEHCRRIHDQHMERWG